jgi:hypothetical protein
LYSDNSPAYGAGILPELSPALDAQLMKNVFTRTPKHDYLLTRLNILKTHRTVSLTLPHNLSRRLLHLRQLNPRLLLAQTNPKTRQQTHQRRYPNREQDKVNKKPRANLCKQVNVDEGLLGGGYSFALAQ